MGSHVARDDLASLFNDDLLGMESGVGDAAAEEKAREALSNSFFQDESRGTPDRAGGRGGGGRETRGYDSPPPPGMHAGGCTPGGARTIAAGEVTHGRVPRKSCLVLGSQAKAENQVGTAATDTSLDAVRPTARLVDEAMEGTACTMTTMERITEAQTTTTTTSAAITATPTRTITSTAKATTTRRGRPPRSFSGTRVPFCAPRMRC